MGASAEFFQQKVDHAWFQREFPQALRKHVRLDALIEERFRLHTSWKLPLVASALVWCRDGTLMIEPYDLTRPRFTEAARDMLVLEETAVDSIVRVRRGCPGRMDDLMYVLAQWYPWAFDERGRSNIVHLASRYVRSQLGSRSGRVRVEYPDAAADPDVCETFDADQWADGDPMFESVSDPLDRYRGRCSVELDLLRRNRGFTIVGLAHRADVVARGHRPKL